MSANPKVIQMKRPPLLAQRSDGSWEFRGHSFDEHVQCWQKVDEEAEECLWRQASIAASLVTKYEEKTVARFAHEVRKSARRVREVAQTYRAFQNGERSPILSFHHHTVAAHADDPVEAIKVAEDNELSTRELDRYIQTGLLPGEKSEINAVALSAVADGLRSVKRKAMTDHVFKALRTVTALKTECPDPKFAADLYTEWEEDLNTYLETMALEDLKDKVINAWKAGNHTEQALATATGITSNDIHGVMLAYKREGIFEKATCSKTAQARGLPRWKWHLKGQPYGSDYSA